MMSYFRVVMLLILLLVLGIIGSSHRASGHDHFDFLSSRDEVVQMAGYGEEKLSTVLITGSLHCESPFHNADADAWPIPGALVGVNCHSHAMERKGRSVVARGVTDEFGDFMVDLPSYLHAIPNLEKICRVKVHRIPKGSHCRPATHVGKKQMGIKLSSIGNGIRTYDAGNIRIQHSTSEPLALQAPHIVKNK